MWKNDEDLQAADLPHMETSVKRNMPQRVCVGIGTYNTVRDGEIYLCALLDPVTKKAGGLFHWRLPIRRTGRKSTSKFVSVS